VIDVRFWRSERELRAGGKETRHWASAIRNAGTASLISASVQIDREGIATERGLDFIFPRYRNARSTAP
jgi:hypothetical protein